MNAPELLQNDNLIPILAICVGGLIAIISILFGMVTHMVKAKERETTKRDIAAYVAEGSISAEEGIRMIEAGTKVDDEDE